MSDNGIIYGMVFYFVLLIAFVLRTIFLQRAVWRLQDRLMKKDMENQALLNDVEMTNVKLQAELNENHYLRCKLDGYPA